MNLIFFFFSIVYLHINTAVYFKLPQTAAVFIQGQRVLEVLRLESKDLQCPIWSMLRAYLFLVECSVYWRVASLTDLVTAWLM